MRACLRVLGVILIMVILIVMVTCSILRQMCVAVSGSCRGESAGRKEARVKGKNGMKEARENASGKQKERGKGRSDDWEKGQKQGNRGEIRGEK